jgi:hypothetical protein
MILVPENHYSCVMLIVGIYISVIVSGFANDVVAWHGSLSISLLPVSWRTAASGAAPWDML